MMFRFKVYRSVLVAGLTLLALAAPERTAPLSE